MTNLHKTLTAVAATFLALALLSAAVAMAAGYSPSASTPLTFYEPSQRRCRSR